MDTYPSGDTTSDLMKGPGYKAAVRIHRAGPPGLERARLSASLPGVNSETLTEAVNEMARLGLIEIRKPVLKSKGWGLNAPGRPATIYLWASDADPKDLWQRAAPAHVTQERAPSVTERLTNIETMLADRLTRIETMLAERVA